ncbi:porin, partial [Myxococcota bacterium]
MRRSSGNCRRRMGCACGLFVTLASVGSAAQVTEADPLPPIEPWYQALEFRLWVDAYASLDTNLPRPLQVGNEFRAYDQGTGFSLSWAGVDVGYEPAPVGGRVGLRLGPTAHRVADSCLSNVTPCDSDVVGLALLKQAYVAWEPVSGLSLEFGKFDTPYGVEVAESQDNANYTRGVLYWLGQPLFHTGLRVRWQPAT